MYRVTRGDGAEAPMLLMDAPACCAEVDMVYCAGVSGVVCVVGEEWAWCCYVFLTVKVER